MICEDSSHLDRACCNHSHTASGESAGCDSIYLDAIGNRPVGKPIMVIPNGALIVCHDEHKFDAVFDKVYALAT